MSEPKTAEVKVPAPNGWADWPRESYDRRYEIGMRDDAAGGASCPMCETDLDQSDAVVIVNHNGSLALCHVACLPDECPLNAPASPPAETGEGLTVDQLAQEIRRVDGNHSLGAGALAEALMPFLSVQPVSPSEGEAVAWRSADHAPSITRGTAKTFVVTIFRAHTNQNHTFAAEYLNAMELGWDEYGDTRMATKTGWFLEVGEDQDFYRPLTLGEGDKFLGWTDLPVFGAATHPASDQSDTERMRKARTEVELVGSIARAAQQDFDSLEAAWRPSKRGSRAQKALDSLKGRISTMEECVNDARAALAEKAADQ